MSDRRGFLKTSTAAMSAAAISAGAVGCATDGDRPTETADVGMDARVLDALAAVVLPGALGDEGRSAAVRSFRAWCDGYEAVAEVNHGYGTSQIRYLPEDPQIRWTAQLSALDLEAKKRFDTAFDVLDEPRRRGLVEARLANAGAGLGRPFDAEHVAAGLLAHWAASTEATDLCYERPVGKLTCRGLDGLEGTS